MYKKILVPLDGSARAEAILRHVEELAQKEEAQVILMHVVDPAASLTGLEGVPFDVSGELIEQERAEAERYLEAKAGELRQRRLDVVTRIRYGEVVKSIVDTAESDNADLIAIASHGRTGLSRLFYGSVAAGVLQRADRPLLIIRAHHDN